MEKTATLKKFSFNEFKLKLSSMLWLFELLEIAIAAVVLVLILPVSSASSLILPMDTLCLFTLLAGLSKKTIFVIIISFALQIVKIGSIIMYVKKIKAGAFILLAFNVCDIILVVGGILFPKTFNTPSTFIAALLIGVALIVFRLLLCICFLKNKQWRKA